MTQNIKFDVMLDGIWKGTFTMPVGKYFAGLTDGLPCYSVPNQAYKDFIEEKRPSLKGKPYTIEFVDKEVKDLWRR